MQSMASVEFFSIDVLDCLPHTMSVYQFAKAEYQFAKVCLWQSSTVLVRTICLSQIELFMDHRMI